MQQQQQQNKQTIYYFSYFYAIAVMISSFNNFSIDLLIDKWKFI